VADGTPWIRAESGPEDKKHAPAAQRNKDAILGVLRDILPHSGSVLEIASGTGEHIVHFAEQLDHLDWQPSDPHPQAVRSICAWRDEKQRDNIAAPLTIDTRKTPWPIRSADAVLCINMVHISPWEATVALFENAANLLKAGAPLYLYGPYFQSAVETAASNAAFHKNLQKRDSRWGLRDVSQMDQLAERSGFQLSQLIEMPANNISLIFRRR